MTRVCLTRHVPSTGFLAPPTASSPFGLADSLGPLPLMGFSLAGLFRAQRPWCVAAPAASLRPWCSTASNSEEYEVESSTDSETLEPLRPGSMAMVPEPPSPLRSTSSPNRRGGFRSRSSPRSLEPSASGRTMTRRAGDPGSFNRSGNQRIYERPAAPLGFLLHLEDVLAPSDALLRGAPACPSEPEVFRGA